jgi:hypothetical protein
MSILFVVLISLIALIIGTGVFLFLIHFIMSAGFYRFFMYMILGIIVLVLYYFIGFYLYMFWTVLSQVGRTSCNMEFWDNIWYTILFAFIILTLTVFIKSVKADGMRWNLLVYSISTLFVLILYTITYYLYIYNDLIAIITGILSGAMVVLTAFAVFLKSYSSSIIDLFYVFYALVTVIFTVSLFMFLFKVLVSCYNIIS